MNWQASATIATLKKRATILAQIRGFFAMHNVLEVETNALSQATVTDLHLESFTTEFTAMRNSKATAPILYLQTSPEYAMKRLLASGSGCIYQIGKAFRNEESGRFHNPEFTMLEWYRVGFDHLALMAEVSSLVSLVLQCKPTEQISYQHAFSKYVGVDPLTCSLAELKAQVVVHQLNADWVLREHNKDTVLQYLFAELVETKIGLDAPCFVFNFPASQASLAKISLADERVAERFELYFKGIELANGFHELTDATEQLKRFEADNKLRVSNNLAEKSIDQHLLSALQSGMPECSGVALGIDRLIMLALNVDSIDEVIAFPVNRA